MAAMICTAGEACPELADNVAAKSCLYCYPEHRGPTMNENTSGAMAPPPSQGSVLPPDWHLICCDEDHGSSSRTPYQHVNNSQRRLETKNAETGSSTGSFAWMSCCEEEACMSPLADGSLRNRQHSYQSFPAPPPTPCQYSEQISQICCSSNHNNGESHNSAGKPFANHVGLQRFNRMRSDSRSTSRQRVGECSTDTLCCDSTHLSPNNPLYMDGVSMDCSEQGCCDLDEFVCQDHDMVGACTDDHGINFGPIFGLGTNANSTADQVIDSASRNQYGSTNNTTQAPQSRAQNDSFAALLSAVVQDATNSGILQIPHSMPTGEVPKPQTATGVHHKRAPSLAQMFEQQQDQQGNVVLGRNSQATQQPQHDRSHQPSASPSIFPYPPTSSPRELAGTPRSDASRQSQLYSNKLMSHNVTNHRSPSAITPESNITLHDSALAYASRLGSQSATSSAVQTPSPLLDALTSNFASREATLVASASSSELVDCPAKKVTKSDCHDHAHVRGQPVLHVCHWQNCHASFTTVQNLLQHISQSHLGLSVGLHANEGSSPVPIQQDAARVEADMNPAKNALGKAGPDVPIHLESDFQSLQEPINLPSNPDVASVLDNILSSSKYGLAATPQSSNSEPISQPLAGLMPSAVYQTATNASDSSKARFASSGDFILNGRPGSQFQNTASQEPTATSFAPNSTNSADGGPIACLWDDCPPFDPFAHFGQQCLDDTCGILPGDVSNTTIDNQRVEQSFDARMLTCDPFCAKEHTHLFPCEPTCSQEHTHVYPMHLHTYPAAQPSHTHNVQLDSATAVLKHLLQQHLGVDLTQGLLNVASQQLGDASALNTATPGHASSTSSAPFTRRASTEKHACSGVQRKCKPLRAPPRKPADDAPADSQTHTCRWHGCTQTFGSVEELTEHLSDVHIGKGKTEYECLWAGCETCEAGKSADGGETPTGRKFTTRQKVMRHMQAHTGYRPFVCPICGTAVSEQATLVAHIRRHSEDRPFHCDAEGCGKSFASAASLAVHKRTHEGQKEHVCPYCDKGFVEASNLNKHIRTHTGEKPFKCQQPGCSKKFSRPDQLKRHAQIHERTDKNQVATSEMAMSGTEESA